MLRSARAVFCLLFLCGSAAAAAETAPDAGSAPIRVLFIGNSYTYFNNLAELVADLGAAAGRKIETQMLARPGYTLETHWHEGAWRDVLLKGRWTHVVLQAQSREPITHYENFANGVRMFDAEIRKNGARTVLFVTWGRDDAPMDQPQLDQAYAKIATELGAMTVPVGTGWSLARTQGFSSTLFHADHAHPAPAGSYLSAAIFFTALTGRSPLGLPGRLLGRPVDVEGRVFDNSDHGVAVSANQVLLADLPAAQAARLQQIALQAIRGPAKPSRP